MKYTTARTGPGLVVWTYRATMAVGTTTIPRVFFVSSFVIVNL